MSYIGGVIIESLVWLQCHQKCRVKYEEFGQEQLGWTWKWEDVINRLKIELNMINSLLDVIMIVGSKLVQVCNNEFEGKGQ